MSLRSIQSITSSISSNSIKASLVLSVVILSVIEMFTFFSNVSMRPVKAASHMSLYKREI